MDEVNNFMQLALQQAELAIEHSEVPVGCVFVDRTTKEVIGTGFNQTNLTCNATRHAELVAIDSILSKGHSVEEKFKLLRFTLGAIMTALEEMGQFYTSIPIHLEAPILTR
eukprot:gene25500-30785_t